MNPDEIAAAERVADELAARLPLELRPHAAHIRDFGLLNAAQIAALTEAERWHVLRDICRVLAVLVNPNFEAPQ